MALKASHDLRFRIEGLIDHTGGFRIAGFGLIRVAGREIQSAPAGRYTDLIARELRASKDVASADNATQMTIAHTAITAVDRRQASKIEPTDSAMPVNRCRIDRTDVI